MKALTFLAALAGSLVLQTAAHASEASSAAARPATFCNPLDLNYRFQISGTASPERVQARVDGGSFSADVVMVPRGNSLRVTLDPQGSDVRQVEVMLRRI